MPHPLVARVQEALETAGPLELAYLELLARRLERLEGWARGETWTEPPSERSLALRFLRPREGAWHDGDENLVREQLDGFARAGEDADQALPRRLLRVATLLGRIEARPETLWFFLWELESLLPRNPDAEG